MNINVSLCNCKTDDVAIVVDQVRASTTITVALNYFNKVIPLNDSQKALKIKEEDDDVILAGEESSKLIEGFDINNSPVEVTNYPNCDTLVLKTTNGTKILEQVEENDGVTTLIGTAINAEAVAKEALRLAKNEIYVVMAGRRGGFNIEDAIGAGIIVEEILKNSQEECKLNDSAVASLNLASDHEKACELILNSEGGIRLKKCGSFDDVKVCTKINEYSNVAIYEDGYLRNIN
ncbi:MAG: 2-phosphosulfolactate phosphatase [Methanosphaera sp.]|uniref:2-phosphosulfolactate phosphatase n=1 Tax=Methanosphaera sp. TaxID=2666342 RepID=UPI0025EF4980|nr:2-phosphosulfolactate phosphatase [Methanosphaera sp.]MCI5867849.1 2-phosphosulfolactate phosphatase [Methanosphaera sp.]MDD6534859.1 2-phosphosulfolactate phosphatase [Methanosphaera sp.]MDY3955319.1 2-phosphosulfolactate phosphatase [Methanosphaera sp.]